jgi:hypothetical protein
MPRALLLVVAIAACVGALAADPAYQLVLGSFSNADNADRWAQQVAADLHVTIHVQPITIGSAAVYRVVTEPLRNGALQQAIDDAHSHGIEFWRLAAPPDGAPDAQSVGDVADLPGETGELPPAARSMVPNGGERGIERPDVDLDIGLQQRTFFERGLSGQSRSDPSVSGELRYTKRWQDGIYNFAMTSFGRYDGQDGHRSHADLREFYFSWVGETWDLNVGWRQVFWGVTEFEHLVDIINQTDLVEDLDGEVKLGQPMVNLSLVRDWGIVDCFVLPYFRERTFPGKNGRLRYQIPVDDGDVSYDSGSKQHHVDWAVRWAHNLGPIEFGLYQFSGTSRAPQLLPGVRDNGDLVLRPYYAQIDQTGLDAQAILGDWALKLEALSRGGQGKRYAAATGGFERTLVGVLGTRADLGLVLEYIWDQRDDEADTVYDHDVAVATRWRLNDAADSQALLGLMWDVRTAEYIVKLEASRRLGDEWSLALEGRVFGGVQDPPTAPPAAVLAAYLDYEHKLDQLARDDYIQLQLTRYF